MAQMPALVPPAQVPPPPPPLPQSMGSTGETGPFEYDVNAFNFLPGDTGGTGAIYMTRMHDFIAFLLEMGQDRGSRSLVFFMAGLLIHDSYAHAALCLQAVWQWDCTEAERAWLEAAADFWFRRARRVVMI